MQENLETSPLNQYTSLVASAWNVSPLRSTELQEWWWDGLIISGPILHGSAFNDLTFEEGYDDVMNFQWMFS